MHPAQSLFRTWLKARKTGQTKERRHGKTGSKPLIAKAILPFSPQPGAYRQAAYGGYARGLQPLRLLWLWRIAAGGGMVPRMSFRGTGQKRAARAGVSLSLLFAFLLPLLLGALPAPSAAAQLARDIAASYCDPDGDRPAQSPHGDHETCCILCPAGGLAALEARDTPIDPAPAPQADVWVSGFGLSQLPGRRIDLAQIVPRGPPSP